ncbi:MAG: rhamnogalacturonan acetylesterase [Lachnospiraceae bacterium]|nr:rhamnogalacturonan acetylesterase [Lachnospiraceae bacterium]
MHFSFCEKGKGTRVKPEDLYNKERGCGFITENNMPVSGLGNHFVIPAYYKDVETVKPEAGEQGVFIDQKKGCERLEASKDRLIPLMFAADVPEYGNYKVKVEICAKGEVLIFAGSRRLVFRKTFAEKTVVSHSFDLNVSPIIPRGQTAPGDRRTVFITVLGEDVSLSETESEKSNVPTLFICGDSTVTDQPADVPYAPGTSYSGWGQMMQDHMSGVAVSNHAHSGLTTESFRSEGHYAIVEEMLKKGDYAMFQFAHNDQKLPHLKAAEGYRERLVQYIAEVRAAGAFPLLVTPLARNTWKPDGGGYNDLLKEYAEECFKIGEEYKVPVIDLHGFSMNEVLRDGLDSSKRFYFPKDYTHTNDHGAYKMARFIAGELEKLTGDYKTLAEASKPDEAEWNIDEIPVVPEIPEKFKMTEKKEEPVLFAELERPDDRAKRCEALDMVIKAAKFFPTNVFNDIYDDIVGHEWYAGTVQCAFQNGLIPKDMIRDKRFRPEEDITLQDLICFAVKACGSRRSLPAPKTTAYEGTCDEYAIEYMKLGVALGLVGENKDPKATLTRREAADICLAMRI